MAGVVGRSGKNRTATTPTDIKLPVLSRAKCEADVRKYIAKINDAMAKGELDPIWARELHKGASVWLNALKQERERTEIDELNAIVAKAEKLHQAGLQQEVADRQHASEEE